MMLRKDLHKDFKDLCHGNVLFCIETSKLPNFFCLPPCQKKYIVILCVNIFLHIYFSVDSSKQVTSTLNTQLYFVQIGLNV